jgi:hypothetical protein
LAWVAFVGALAEWGNAFIGVRDASKIGMTAFGSKRWFVWRGLAGTSEFLPAWFQLLQLLGVNENIIGCTRLIEQEILSLDPAERKVSPPRKCTGNETRRKLASIFLDLSAQMNRIHYKYTCIPEFLCFPLFNM